VRFRFHDGIGFETVLRDVPACGNQSMVVGLSWHWQRAEFC